MVEYDSDNSALTLGDDDTIAIGDYSLRYSSANDRFEVEHPNGEISDVPRSTSGSLVPQGLAESVGAGEALADDGNTYASVQTAVDNASGFVFVGPGTFNEAVTISTKGLTLEGCGRDSVIDSTGIGSESIAVSASDVTVTNISTDGRLFEGDVIVSSTNVTVSEVSVISSGTISVQSGASDANITNCRVNSADRDGIAINSADRAIVSNCVVDTTGLQGIIVDSCDDCIVSNCVIKDASNNGVYLRTDTASPNDNICIGNRIIRSGGDGFTVNNGTDNIFANNRISDSANVAIDDNGTGTVLDDNKTGASN